MIKGQIELANKSIKQSEHYIKTYVDLYQKTELDKCRYNLKYYVVGDGLTYERVSRKKIGFLISALISEEGLWTAKAVKV